MTFAVRMLLALGKEEHIEADAALGADFGKWHNLSHACISISWPAIKPSIMNATPSVLFS